MGANDNQTFECESSEGHFLVTLEYDRDYWVWKLIAPHTFFNRTSEVRKCFVDKCHDRASAVRVAREHANMRLPDDFAPGSNEWLKQSPNFHPGDLA